MDKILYVSVGIASFFIGWNAAVRFHGIPEDARNRNWSNAALFMTVGCGLAATVSVVGCDLTSDAT